MDRRGWRTRIPGVLFLAVVIVAAALLVAGYGVAVGVGVIVGLLLGASAGLLGTMWLVRGPGREVHLASLAWDSRDETETSMADLQMEIQDLTEVLGVDIGITRAVLPVIATVTDHGLAVQLVSVEIHEAGATFTLDVRALPGSPPPPSFAQATVTDADGTLYRTSGQAQGGGPSGMRFHVVVIPRPAPSVPALSIRIDQFVDPFPGNRRVAAGPWSFDVTLHPGSGTPPPLSSGAGAVDALLDERRSRR
jgi:hypothetical protein